MLLLRRSIAFLVLWMAVAFALADQNETATPTISPTTTMAPTSFSNDTAAPTTASSQADDTPAPSTLNLPSAAPTTSDAAAPTARPSHHYVPATEAPSVTPTVLPPTSSPKKKSSIVRIIGRAFGWLFLIALSVLLFGAVMSNRYRIYYALRGLWYTILRLDCTRWIIRNFRDLRGDSSSSSLNEIIFDQGSMSEGLLMRDNETDG